MVMANPLARRDAGTWDPFGSVWDEDLSSRLFDRWMMPRQAARFGEFHAPSVEISDEKDALVVKADMPGIKKEELDISVQGRMLTLHGERKREEEKKDKHVSYSERFYGTFSRMIELPVEVSADKVKATYKDGVLHITLPKGENVKPKQIRVDIL